MGLSAVIPVLHGLSMYGVEKMETLMGLRWAVLEGLLYLTGATLYAVRHP
jgi:adiponectin receptor